MEKIDIDDFLKLKRKDRNKMLCEISENLCKEICKLKNIEYDEDIFYTAKEIYYNSIYFSNFESYCRDVSHIVREDVKRVKKIELKNVISSYNGYINKIKKYKQFENKIQKEGFSNLEKKYKENLRSLFNKMLDFKKRKYDKNGALLDLIEEIELCYYDFDYIWSPLYQLLYKKCIYKDTIRDEFWVINADDVEYLDILNRTYEYFSEDEKIYKDYEPYFEEITLEENQTLEDVYNTEIEKIKKLFIEMLKYKNIEIKEDDYKSIKNQVFKNYEKFQDSLIHYEFIVEHDVHGTYIDMITEIRKEYKYLEENYRK